MLDVIIVNYRTAELTVEALRSVEPELGQIDAARVWIVENGSGDESRRIISDAIERHGWQSWARLKISDVNLGFAGGNNAALVEILQAVPSSRYVLLLNPDTVVRTGGIVELLRFMEARPDVGIAGSRLENLDATVQRSAFQFPTWQSEFESAFRMGWMSRKLQRWVVAPIPREIAHQTDWVCGASMLVRREVFDTIGILDDRYFMYFEELDFCLRAQQAGWPCWYVPMSRVVHLVGQSSGVTVRKPKRRPLFWFAARRHFYMKHYGRMYTLWADMGWASAYAFHRVVAAIRRLKISDPPWLWWDFVAFNFSPKHLFSRNSYRTPDAQRT